MKLFEVELTKSYIVRIKTKTKKKAKEIAELFTSDIQDISTQEYKKKFSFEIIDIECTFNKAFEAKELK